MTVKGDYGPYGAQHYCIHAQRAIRSTGQERICSDIRVVLRIWVVLLDMDMHHGYADKEYYLS